jgi:hypothetical protein
MPAPVVGAIDSSSQARGEISSTLKAHGALEDLPHLDRIEVSRPGKGYSVPIFFKGTNGWNQFTALEALAVEYELLSSIPEGEVGSTSTQKIWAEGRKLGFPDLAGLRIRRPEADLKTWHERKVDLSAVVASGDCSKDVPLSWGEVVEVPEADHPLNEQWQGFSEAELANLNKCLSREVQVIIKGRGNKLTVGPRFIFSRVSGIPLSPASINIGLKAPVWLKPALRQSNLLLASSDLSRVKVTRKDSGTGQKREWVLDCSDGKPAPALWLRDGDVIEVPEKP